MSANVEMRDLFGETRPLNFATGTEPKDPFMVDVPSFGCLIVGSVRSDEPISRLAPARHALLVQPDAERRFSDASNRKPYDVTVKEDGSLEVELLPNVSGEDQLVVVVHPTSELSQ